MRNDLSLESRVWVYQAERQMNQEEIDFLTSQLQSFCTSWTAHNVALKADCDIIEKRFIILTVDETQAGASGCSIDKSVKALKELSDKTGINFFDRMQVFYKDGEQIVGTHLSNISTLKQEGIINNDTLFYNPLVKTIAELKDSFILPLKQHWLNK